MEPTATPTGPAPVASAPSPGSEPGWRGSIRLLRGPLRTLVSGQALGQAGDGLAQVAFAQLVLFEVGRGATPGDIAGVLAATLLPYTVAGPLAGVLVDRWRRRRVLVLASWTRVGIALAAVGIAASHAEVLAYVGVVLLLSTSRFVLTAKGAVLPRTVPRSSLVTANGLSAVIGMVAGFSGAVLGSTFVGASVGVGFAAAAACYLGAGLVFARLPEVGGGEGRGQARRRLRQAWLELAQGMRVVVTDRAVRRPLTAVWGHRLLLGAGFIVLILVADRRYQLEASGYGLALAVTGAGAFTGSLTAPVLARRWSAAALLPLPFLVAGVTALAAARSPGLPAIVAALGVVAFVFQLLKVLADALVGGATDDHVRGRVFAAYDVIYNVAFVVAGLAMVPLWEPGREDALLAGVGVGYLVGWLVLARTAGRWPFDRQSGPTAPTGRRWRRRGLAMLFGALPVMAFPAPSVWAAAWVALVPVLLLLRTAAGRRDAALEGWAAGTGYGLAALHWLLPNLGPGLLLAAGLLGVVWVPWAVAARALLAGHPSTGRLLAALVVLPALWVVGESARGWSELGGPWALLGSSQWNAPGPRSLAELGGVWLLSLAVVTVNVAVLAAVLAVGIGPRLLMLGTAAALLVAGPLWEGLRGPAVSAGTVRLAVVQPGVVHDPMARFEAGERLTRRAAARSPDLVVWGESSVGFDLDRRPDLLGRLRALAAETRAPLLVNVDARTADGHIAKRTVLVGERGVLGSYAKMRLVPFGEYVPARRVLGWLPQVSRAAGEDRVPGDRPVVLRRGPVAIGPLICFESAFPDMARTVTRMGADVIVIQSSTSTFQGSWAPQQHAALAALRAAETGRPVVHATLTGQSAVYDADGARLAMMGTSVRDVMVLDVPLDRRETPYVRYGDWPVGWSLLVLGGAGVVVALDDIRHRP